MGQFAIGENYTSLNAFNSASGLPQSSLSFTSASSQSLSLTDANFGAFDTAKFAIEGLIKRKSVGVSCTLIDKFKAGGQNSFRLWFDSLDHLEFEASEDGTNFAGRRVTIATYTSTTAFYHFLAWYDSANADADARMRVWVNGTEVDNASGFSAQPNPTAGVFDGTGNVTLGAATGGGDYCNGIVYQLSFFSGALPAIGTVYNSGAPLDVTHLTGLYSTLDVSGGVVTHDGVIATAWTNNNTVTASGVHP